jgi:hypothetical protein
MTSPEVTPAAPRNTVSAAVSDGERAAMRATGLQLRSQAELITSRLLRKLLRGLGTEFLLAQSPFGQGGQL